jgi:hypothetical protein
MGEERDAEGNARRAGKGRAVERERLVGVFLSG